MFSSWFFRLPEIAMPRARFAEIVSVSRGWPGIGNVTRN
jgi:hypothetical protein